MRDRWSLVAEYLVVLSIRVSGLFRLWETRDGWEYSKLVAINPPIRVCEFGITSKETKIRVCILTRNVRKGRRLKYGQLLVASMVCRLGFSPVLQISGCADSLTLFGHKHMNSAFS